MLTIYLVEDYLYIVDKTKVINKRLEGIIDKGNIVDKSLFIEEFNKISKKEKIKTKLFGDKIEVVKQAYYNKRDLFFLESVFGDLGFLKVQFRDIYDFILDDIRYVEINNSYMVVYVDDVGLMLDLQYFKDIPKILSIIIPDDKQVALFGLNNLIPKIKVKEKEMFFLENYKTFIIDSLLKVKKCGA